MPSPLQGLFRFTTLAAVVAVALLTAGALFLVLGPRVSVEASRDSQTSAFRATAPTGIEGVGQGGDNQGGEHNGPGGNGPGGNGPGGNGPGGNGPGGNGPGGNGPGDNGPGGNNPGGNGNGHGGDGPSGSGHSSDGPTGNGHGDNNGGDKGSGDCSSHSITTGNGGDGGNGCGDAGGGDGPSGNGHGNNNNGGDKGSGDCSSHSITTGNGGNGGNGCGDGGGGDGPGGSGHGDNGHSGDGPTGNGHGDNNNGGDKGSGDCSSHSITTGNGGNGGNGCGDAGGDNGPGGNGHGGDSGHGEDNGGDNGGGGCSSHSITTGNGGNGGNGCGDNGGGCSSHSITTGNSGNGGNGCGDNGNDCSSHSITNGNGGNGGNGCGDNGGGCSSHSITTGNGGNGGNGCGDDGGCKTNCGGPQAPTITINKVCSPTNDTGKFNLQLGNPLVTVGANTACGQGTGPIATTVGSHTVGETAGTATDLANYNTPVISGDCAANGSITLAAGQNKTCTITNTRKGSGEQSPLITINKVCVPANDTGKFNLQLGNPLVTVGADTTCGGSITTTTTAGSHIIGETAGTGTNLANYTKVISGDCAADGSITLAGGQNKTCTITNTRIGGQPGCTSNCGTVTTTETSDSTPSGGGGGGSSDSPPSGGGGGTTFAPPVPQVLGSSAVITKTRASDDPAVVGETVTFTATLTITGDTTMSDVTMVDTFENKYLGAVGTLPAGCTLTTASPDLAHNTIRCAIGTVTPGTAGAPGSKVFSYTFAMLALTSTGPGRTVNEARATFDPDAGGPAGPAAIGPATATVQIVDATRVLLPPTGDGSMSPGATTGWVWALGICLVIALAGARYARRPAGNVR